MKLSASTPQEIADCSKELNYVPTLNVNGITCRSDDDTLLGVVLFDGWTWNAVQCHIWSASPMAFKGGHFVRETWDYVRSTGRTLVIGVTPGDNEASLNFQFKLGFEMTHRIPDGWAKGVDMVITEKRLDDGQVSAEAA